MVTFLKNLQVRFIGQFELDLIKFMIELENYYLSMFEPQFLFPFILF